MWIKSNKGINVIEVIVIVALVFAMVAVSYLSVMASEKKTRDSERISDISQIGRLFYKECYTPAGGGGDYDLVDIFDEIMEIYPEQKKYISGDFIDPTVGSDEKSYYTYRVAEDGKHCVLFASLEGQNESITLPAIAVPTMGGRTGVFEATSEGVNGSKKFYQVSK